MAAARSLSNPWPAPAPTATVTPIRPPTLFQRLAVLRRQLERARADIESLRAACVGGEEAEDLGAQLYEADSLLKSSVDYLTPTEQHVDRPLPLDGEDVRP
jgi:hypothetical protein